jgi:hypothetical protein
LPYRILGFILENPIKRAAKQTSRNISKNRLVVMFRRRYGRLQRQCHYAFIAHEEMGTMTQPGLDNGEFL